MSEKVPQPTELIYTPSDSWAPALIGVGAAVMVLAVWSHWWWAVVGAILVLSGLVSWWRRSGDEIARMRREQELSTAVIPAEPIRRMHD